MNRSLECEIVTSKTHMNCIFMTEYIINNDRALYENVISFYDCKFSLMEID